MARYLICNYYDANGKSVEMLGLHESDEQAVLARPLPSSAIGRDPMVEYRQGDRVTEWFRGKSPMKVGECFSEFINQGQRECEVVAVDEKTGEYLYEYDMPAGSTALRRQNNATVPYNRIPRKWLRLIHEQFGLRNLKCEPQQAGAAAGRTREALVEAAARLDAERKSEVAS